MEEVDSIIPTITTITTTEEVKDKITITRRDSEVILIKIQSMMMTIEERDLREMTMTMEKVIEEDIEIIMITDQTETAITEIKIWNDDIMTS